MDIPAHLSANLALTKLAGMETAMQHSIEVLEDEMDDASKSVITFLQTDVKLRVEALKAKLKKLQASPENALLRQDVEDKKKHLIQKLNTQYHAIEAKKDKLENASTLMAAFKSMMQCWEMPQSAVEKHSQDAVHHLFEERLQEIAQKLKAEPLKKPLSCFMSYAWGVKEHEQFVHQLAAHIKKAGIENTFLDIWDNKTGAFINYFTEKVETVNYVILVGTQNLKRKHVEGKELYEELEKAKQAGDQTLLAAKAEDHAGFIVCKELGMISQKATHQPGSVIPLLVDGKLHECLPAEYTNVVPLYFTDRQNPHVYYRQVFELLKCIARPYTKDIEAIADGFFKLLEVKGEIPKDFLSELAAFQQKQYETDKAAAGVLLQEAATKRPWGASEKATQALPIAPSANPLIPSQLPTQSGAYALGNIARTGDIRTLHSSGASGVAYSGNNQAGGSVTTAVVNSDEQFRLTMGGRHLKK